MFIIFVFSKNVFISFVTVMCITDENRSSPMRKPMTLMYKPSTIWYTKWHTNNMKPHENHLKHTVLYISQYFTIIWRQNKRQKLYCIYCEFISFRGIPIFVKFVDRIKQRNQKCNEYLATIYVCTDYSRESTNLHIHGNNFLTKTPNIGIHESKYCITRLLLL